MLVLLRMGLVEHSHGIVADFKGLLSGSAGETPEERCERAVATIYWGHPA